MEDIIKRCNPIVDLSKRTFNKKILNKVLFVAKIITNFIAKFYLLTISAAEQLL